MGGHDGSDGISKVELFPLPPSDTCSIPDLPQGRYGHSLSLLSGGRLVVCGGYDGSNFLDSCVSWVAGNTSWTPLYTMRCHPMIIIDKSELSSPRAKRAGPKGPCAESARAVTGRRCPHSGVGEDFLGHRPSPLTKTGVTRERKVVD